MIRLFLIAGAMFAIAQPMTLAGAEQPNVLFILTEDQGAHLGFLQTPGLSTPNMDRIANAGTYFREAFVCYPVCSASKAAIYTGLYNHVNGLRGNTINLFKAMEKVTAQERRHPLFERSRIRDEYPTLIECLDQAGFYTGVTQKLHVLPNRKFPYDEFLRGERRETVTGFIERAGRAGQPWFLLFNIGPPHRPFRNSQSVTIGVDHNAVELPAFLPNTAVVRRDWAEYLDAIQVADERVGQALDALDASGQADRTIIIVMGDHGPAFQRGKMSLHDFGLRVPLAISGPGIQSETISNALVSELHLMPTILDLLGIARPKLQHGRSLCALLEGRPGATGHKMVFAEIAHLVQTIDNGMQERSVYDGRFHLIARRGIGKPRTVNADLRDWKLWRNRTYAETVARKAEFPMAYEMLTQIDPQRLGGIPLTLEFYDTSQDPDEIKNLASDPKYRAHVDRLRAGLKNWAHETNDEFFLD